MIAGPGFALAANAVSDKTPDMTVDDYRTYLKDRAGSHGRAVRHFTRLGAGKQRRIVGLLNDEQIAQEVADAFRSDSAIVKLEGGDIVIGTDTDADDPGLADDAGVAAGSDELTFLVYDRSGGADAWDFADLAPVRPEVNFVGIRRRTATVSRYVTILGFTVMRATTWVEYGHWACCTKAVRAYAAGRRHVNYYPLNSLSGQVRGPWLSSGRARAATDWTVTTCALPYTACVSNSGTQHISARKGSVRQWWN